MLLQEKAQYDLYKNKIDKVTFDKLCDADPTNGNYDVWIVNIFLKYFPSYCEAYILYNKIESMVPHNAVKNAWSDSTALEFVDLHKKLDILKQEKSTQITLGYHYLKTDLYKVTQSLTLYDALKRKNKLPPILKVGIKPSTGTQIDYHMAVLGTDQDQDRVVKEKDSKNIMNFPSFGYLIDFLDDEITDETIASLEDESKLAKQIEVVYPLDEKGFWCGIPLTYEASRKLGRNTHWCTAADSEDGRTQFTNHSKDGPLYVLFTPLKQEDANKVQIHITSDQWKDASDTEVDDAAFNSREDFVRLLPPELVRRLHERTDALEFLTDEQRNTLYDKALQMPEVFQKIVELLKRLSISEIINFDEIKSFSDIVGDKFLRMGVSDTFDNDDNDDSWSYGYDHPWEFIQSEPAGEIPSEEEKEDSYDWTKNADVWSEEQRDEAGQVSSEAYHEGDVDNLVREIDRGWTTRNYKDTANEIWDYILINYITMGDSEAIAFLKNQMPLLQFARSDHIKYLFKHIDRY